MKRTIYLMIGGLVLVSTAAYAEMIQGTIASMDSSRNQLSIQCTDPAKGIQLVQVKENTKTKNVASPQELQVGQEVKVDAKKKDNLLEAKSIEVTSAQETQNPSSSSSEPSSAGTNKTAQY